MTSLAHRKKICQGTEYYQKMPLRRNYLKLDGKNSAVHVTLQLKKWISEHSWISLLLPPNVTTSLLG